MQFKQKLGYITLSVVFMMVVLLGIAPIGLAQVVTKADMPTAGFALSTSVVDGKIYAIGGGPTARQVFSTVEEYDPATDTWITKADMPTARSTLSTSVVDGKIYAIGGLTGGWSSLSTVEMYDPATDTWTTKADMPTAREFVSTSAVNGKIYAIGGCIGTDALARVEEYDPATDTWTTKADMPTARGKGLSASVVNGKIYAIGGSLVDITWTNVSTVEEYDPATDTWATKADMPTRRAYHSTSVVDGKIYVVGGVLNYDKGALCPTVEEYDPATDTWTTRADMVPTPRSSLSTSAVNGRIYVIGGADTPYPSYEACPTVEEYSPGVAASATSVGMATWGQVKSLLK